MNLRFLLLHNNDPKIKIKKETISLFPKKLISEWWGTLKFASISWAILKSSVVLNWLLKAKKIDGEIKKIPNNKKKSSFFQIIPNY